MRKKIKPIIGSILVSMLLWFMVTTSKDYTTQIIIPLEISRLARGKTLLEPIPAQISLEIRGTGQSLIALYFFESNFRLELPQIKKSTKILLEDYLVFLDLPSRLNLEVVEIIDPKSLDLKIDDFIVEKKPIIFAGQVSTEPGYIIMDTLYSQDSIAIAGPKSIIDTIQHIQTEKEIFQKQKYAFNKQIVLKSPAPNLIKLNPNEVEIQFEIQRLIERVIYEIPVTIKNIPDNLIVEALPPNMSLRIKGGEKIVEKVSSSEIHAEIDFKSQYEPEQTEYPVSIKTPAEISWLESSPKTFKLTIKRK